METEKMRFSPLMRQVYVALSLFFASISAGGAVGYPMVLLQQLKAEGSTIELDFGTASWMGSIHGIAGIPSIFMPALMQWKGRKFVFILNCITTIIGWMIAYIATDATALLISESIHGFGTNSLLAVSCLTITEMMSPQYRDAFMQIIYVFQVVGMAADGLLVQYFHWKTISIIMVIPISISLLLSFTLPESPHWLAYKGDMSTCEKNFAWLRGTDAASKKELHELTTSEVKNITNSFRMKSMKQLRENITSRDFIVPALHITVLQFLIYGCGSVVTLIYPIVILKNLTKNDNVSNFGGFIMNAIFCLGTILNIVMEKYFKKKLVLLSGVVITTAILISASIFSGLQDTGVWPKDTLVGLYLLSGFMLSTSLCISGPAYCLAATLMPVKNRGLGGALLIINTGMFHTASLKAAPYMFLYLNMWGTFLVYSAVAVTCGLLIWRFVPETKGRSLEELESYYKHGIFNNKSRFPQENCAAVADIKPVTSHLLVCEGHNLF